MTPNLFLETIVTTTGTINNLVAQTGFLRFTGSSSVVLTGKDSALNQANQGITLAIRNETGSSLVISHLSASSSDANRFYIPGEVDLTLADNGMCVFYYSNTLLLWVLSETFGNGYSPQYVGQTNKVVTSVGDGTTNTLDTVEIQVVNTTISSAQTAAQLNTLYPNAVTLFTVVCPNITGGGIAYICYDGVNHLWCQYSITLTT